MVILSPGVYWRELDFSPYAQALATSTFGLVTTASKGPVNERTLITDEAALIRTFGYPSATHLGIHAALRYLRKGSLCHIVRVADYDAAAEVDVPNGVNDAVTFTAASTGSWGNALSVRVLAGTAVGTYRILVLSSGAVVESYGHIRLGTAYVSDANYITTRINADSQYVVVTVTDATQTGLTVATYTLTGGDDGSSVSSSDIIGVMGTPPTVPRTGLQIFRDSETVDINLIAVPGNSHRSVVSELIDIATDRQDCMVLIDPPYGLSVQGVVDWHNGTGGGPTDPTAALNSTYAALYYPWLQVTDGYSGSDVWLPPSGHMAGVMAYTDYAADAWFSPAGLNRAMFTDVIDIEYSPNQGDRDYMYSGGNAVNPICKFSGIGYTAWGQRTLQRTATATDRINVRRLLLYLEKIVATGAMYFVHEPNDEYTWRAFERFVQPVLDNLIARRGITRGQVTCDATTNPDTNPPNEMHGIVLIDPIEAAESIVVTFGTAANSTSFDEIVQQLT